MRKITLIAASASLAAGVLGGATFPRPAFAAGNQAFVQWQSPDDGARVSGQSVHIKAKVAFGDHGVKSWAVEVLAPATATYPGYGTICEDAVGGAPTSVNVDCAWDTTAYPNDGGQAQNRAYVVRISAENAERGAFAPPTTMHHDDRNVTVANPVSAPRDVRLAFSESNRQATVQWQPNPEPDITSYIVQERVGDGSWKTVGQAGGKVTTFTRTLATAGTYRYQVAALRSAGTGSDTLQSAWTGPAGDPKQIVVADPPRPSTTTSSTAPAADNSGSGDSPSPGGPAPGAPAAGDPGSPPPVTASGAVNDPSASAAGAPPAGGNRGSAAIVTPIQAGAPGSVRSGGATTGNLTTAPTAKPAKATTTTENEGPDPGFSSALPYKDGAPDSDKEDGQAMGRVLVGLPEAIGGESARNLLIPLAGALALFVLAMHAFYASRRAAVEAPLEAE